LQGINADDIHVNRLLSVANPKIDRWVKHIKGLRADVSVMIENEKKIIPETSITSESTTSALQYPCTIT
jgi:hypothetical protein